MIRLAIRLQKLPHELEMLSMPEIAEIVACLKEGDNPEPEIEEQLRKVFGKPNGRS